MTQILVTKPGVLNQRDRSALRKAGVVCVEADRPEEVRLIQAEGPALSGDDMLVAVLTAINSKDLYAKDARASLPGIMLSLLEARQEGERG